MDRFRILITAYFSNIPKLNQFPQVFDWSELTKTEFSGKIDSYSYRYPSEIEEARKKRSLEFPDLLRSIDSAKLLFPKGVLTKVREGSDDVPQVRRIELFAKDGGDTYGIIRSLFVGFSSEKSILQIAEASGGVVQVRAVRTSKGKKESFSPEGSGDMLLLRRDSSTPPADNPGFRVRIPSITISPRWKERMRLSEEDCLMISNPIQDYAVPPPNV